MLEAYRASKRAIWPNSPVDISCIGAELRFAYHFLAHDGDGNIRSFAATVWSRRRRGHEKVTALSGTHRTSTESVKSRPG